MAYNSTATAEAIIGQSLSVDLLDVATAIIHAWTDYRWAETTISETFSGDGESFWLDLRAPIISISSFTIEDISQTEDTDYEIRKPEGRIRIYSSLAWGHDNILITYKYGWTNIYGFYSDTLPLVKLAEAQIALYIKKNPLMLRTAAIGGITIAYQDTQIIQYLAMVPKMPSFVALGPGSLTESRRGYLDD